MTCFIMQVEIILFNLKGKKEIRRLMSFQNFHKEQTEVVDMDYTIQQVKM